MSTDAKAAARRLYETFTRAMTTGDFELLDAVVDRDAVDHNPDPDMKPGLAGIKEAFGELRSAFPDTRFAIEDLVAEGDKVFVRLTVRATHRGAFLGIAPTGREVTYALFDLLRFTGGKLVERWGLVDVAALKLQLEGSSS